MSAAQWWVVNQLSGPGGSRSVRFTTYVIVQSSTRPVNAVAGPFATRAEAEAWQTSANTAGNSPGSAIGGAAKTVARLTGLAAIGDFFQRLTQGSTWIRVAEAVLGLGLLVVGVARLASGTAAGRAALKAGKAAAIL